jgi:hypothetical protein
MAGVLAIGSWTDFNATFGRQAFERRDSPRVTVASALAMPSALYKY